MTDNARPTVNVSIGEKEMTLMRAGNDSTRDPVSELLERYDAVPFKMAKKTYDREEVTLAVRGAFQEAYEQLKQFRQKSRLLTCLIESVLNESLVKLPR